MRTIRQAVEWAKAHDGKDAPGGPGHCLEDVRTAYGCGPWATSAKLAYERVPHDQLHIEHNPHAIPEGAIVYYPELSQYGHVTLSLGGGKCLSNDYLVKGKLGICPVDLPRWGVKLPLYWTYWTPDGIAHN